MSDSAIISNKAKARIEKDFLQSINYCVTSINELENFNVFVNNLCNSKRKIFLNDSVSVENDLDPFLDANSKTKDDKLVKEYYRYLFDNYSNKNIEQDLFSFKNIRVSGLKRKGQEQYVKVYFEIENHGYKTDSKKVEPASSKRIAEIYFSKPNQFKEAYEVFIVSLRYFDPAIPITDTTNNISWFDGREEFDKRRNEGNLFFEGNDEMAETNKRAKDLTAAGTALKEGDFARALMLCNLVLANDNFNAEALKIKNETEKLQEEIEAENKKIELLKRDFNTKDSLRQYEQAAKIYNEIIRLKPEFSNAAIQNEKDRINKILADVSELQSSYKSKNYEEIIDKCNKKLPPSDNKPKPEFYYWRGKAYLLKGKNKSALEDFTVALKIAPKYNDVLIALAEYYKALGQEDKSFYNDALKYHTHLVLNNPQEIKYYVQRAEVRRLIGQKKDAVTEDYDEALKIDGNNGELYFLKGQTLFEIGESKNAVKVLTMAIGLLPDSAKYYFFRGMSYEKLDSIKKAGDDFRMAIEKKIDQDGKDRIFNISHSYFAKGKTEFDRNKFADARFFFEKAALLYDLSDNYFYAGLSTNALHDWSPGIEKFDNAIKFSPKASDETRSHYHRGIAFLTLKEYAKALEDFKLCIRSRNVNFIAPSYAYAGTAFFLQGNYTDALPNIQESLKHYPDSAKLHNMAGMCMLNLGKPENSKTEFDIAIKKFESDSSFYFNRGIALYRMKEYKDARKDLIRANELRLNNDEVHFYTGLCFYYSEKYEDALPFFKKAAEINKNFADAHYYKALCEIKLKQFNEAIKSLAAALEHSDKLSKDFSPETHLGYCYFKTLKYKEAGTHLEAALKKNNDDGYALFYKACVAISEKHNEEAFTLIEQALKTKKISFTEVADEPIVKEIKKTDEFRKIQNQYGH
ncbi:MAG: tetratricopeptide repeat protein [Bacteroidia bacterium]